MSKINKTFVTDILKALLFSVLISFGSVIVFAIIVRFAAPSPTVMQYVNSAIKAASVLTGAILGFSENKQGLLKGFIFGILYITVTFLLFAAADGGFDNAQLTVADALFGVFIGAISGIIAVNVKKDRQIG